MIEPLTTMYIKGVAPSPRGSIFSNFETVQVDLYCFLFLVLLG